MLVYPCNMMFSNYYFPIKDQSGYEVPSYDDRNGIIVTEPCQINPGNNVTHLKYHVVGTPLTLLNQDDGSSLSTAMFGEGVRVVYLKAYWDQQYYPVIYGGGMLSGNHNGDAYEEITVGTGHITFHHCSRVQFGWLHRATEYRNVEYLGDNKTIGEWRDESFVSETYDDWSWLGEDLGWHSFGPEWGAVSTCNPISPSDPPLGLYNRINRLFTGIYEGNITNTSVSYAECCLEAAEKIQYDHINTVSQIYETLTLKRGLMDMFSSFKAVFDKGLPLQKSKDVANAYLSGKYGPRLTLGDWADVATRDAIPPKGTSTAMLTGELSIFGDVYQVSKRVSFAYQLDYFQRIAQRCEQHGIGLRLTDVWDLVPMSFVVDWFVDVSEILDNLHDRKFAARLPVSSIWDTDIYKGVVSASNQDWFMTADIKVYHRQERTSLSVDFTPSSRVTVPQHLVELGAVIIQRL